MGNGTSTAIAIFALVAAVVLSGCTETPEAIPVPTTPTTLTTETRPETGTTTPQPQEPQFTGGIDNYPSISGKVDPSNPSLGQSFTLTLSSTDDKGVQTLSWHSSKPFSNYGQSSSFDCNMQASCSHTWELVTNEEGLHQLTATALDSSGKDGTITIEADVQPARPVTSTTPTSTTTVPPSTTSTTTVEEGTCSSNSDCGYKQRCQSGKCASVQCTTNSHCTGCKRCSDYTCVSCGSGPYGCYC